jgi:quinoprotein glucose dehydrogenase
LARLHALWGLGQLAVKDASALSSLPALLDDADPEVRAHTARLLGDFKFAGVSKKLIALLQDKENRVRFFAALSLGKLGDRAAFEPLCAMLSENDDQDPILRHGGVMGLLGTGSPEQIAANATVGSIALRGDSVVALRRLQSPLIAAFLADADESVVLEAARAIHDAPIEPVMPALAALTANRKIQNPHILSRAVNANYRLGQAENAKALAALAADSAAPESARKDALEALTIWAHPDSKDRLLNQWRPLADRGDSDAAAAIGGNASALLINAPNSIQESVAKLAGKLALKAAGEPLAALAVNQKAGAAARAEAIKALITLKDSHLAEVAKVAVNDKNAPVRIQGLQALATTDPAAAVKIIEGIVTIGSLTEKQGALTALRQIQGDLGNTILSGLLDQLIAHQVPAEIQLDLINAAIAHDNAELKAKLQQYEASLPASDDLAKWRVALVGGDAERGRTIFREKAETQCLRCHKCEIGDSQVGPELTHIGSKKSREYLLESIIYPNKQIAEGFETVVLTLTDGSIVAGRLAKQNAQELKIETFDAAGQPKTETVPVEKIKDRQRAPSPMPPNFADLLTKSELRDLVEYLALRK